MLIGHFVCLAWKNVSPGPLPIFKLDCLFSLRVNIMKHSEQCKAQSKHSVSASNYYLGKSEWKAGLERRSGISFGCTLMHINVC